MRRDKTGNFIYTVNRNSSVTILHYIGTGYTNIEIPKTVDGKSVSELASDTLSVMTKSRIRTLIIKAEVVSVPSGLCRDCKNLRSVVLNSSIKCIENDAFENCDNLVNLSGFSNVEYIGVAAFSGCRALRDLPVTASTTFIDASAFYGCSSITENVIPSSRLEIIGSYAFMKSGISGIDLANCGPKVLKGHYIFEDCGNLKTVRLPKDIKTLNNGMFTNCSKLHVVLGTETLRRIGPEAFTECVDLNYLRFRSLEKIAENTFSKDMKMRINAFGRAAKHSEVFEYLKDFDGIEITKHDGSLRQAIKGF